MDKIQYCILCGAQNRINDKFCHKCGESLDQKDDRLQSYVGQKAKEKTKEIAREKAENAFIKWLENLLRSKAYGIILALSVVASVANVIAGRADTDKYITRFSADLPGTFIDGVQYGQMQDINQEIETENEKILFSFYLDCVAKYDSQNNIDRIFLRPDVKSGSILHLLVTKSGGETATYKFETVEDTYNAGLIDITGTDCTIEIVEEKLDESVITRKIYEIDKQAKLLSRKEFKNGIPVLYEKYNDGTDIVSYRENYDEAGEITGTLENDFYPDNTIKTSKHYTVVDGEKLLRIENHYGPDGLRISETDYNTDGSIMRSTIWNENGYWHSVYYKEGTDVKISEHFNAKDETGSIVTLRQIVYYDDGKLIDTEYIYDIDTDTAIRTKYSYRGATDGSQYGYKMHEDYLAINSDGVLTEVKTIYYDESGQIADQVLYNQN